MADQSQITKEKAIEYALTFEGPAEVYFLSDTERKKIAADTEKLNSSINYYKKSLENPGLAEKMDKVIFNGEIFSFAEAEIINARLKALDGIGHRGDVKKSLISPQGDIVIISDRVANKMGFAGDGYVLMEDLDDLIKNLKEEQIQETELQKLNSAVQRNGAIVIQLGVYTALRPLLNEVVGAVGNVMKSFESYRSNIEKPAPLPPKATPTTLPQSAHGASLTALRDLIEKSPAAAGAKSSGPAMTPTEIKREVATKELPEPGVEAPVLPKTYIAPQTPIKHIRSADQPPVAPTAGMKLNTSPSSGLNSVKDISVVDDLKKIQAAHLRLGYLPEVVKQLRAKVAYLAGVNKMLPVQVVTVFEQSPLFKLYLQIGSAMISQSTHDKKADYRNVITELANKGQEILSFQEFEAIADLRKDLERM